MFNEQDRKYFYNEFKNNGYQVGSYDDFKKDLNNKEDRDWYYNEAKNMGYDVGSQEDFDKMVLEPSNSSTATVSATPNTSSSPAANAAPQTNAAPQAKTVQQPQVNNPQQEAELTKQGSEPQGLLHRIAGIPMQHAVISNGTYQPAPAIEQPIVDGTNGQQEEQRTPVADQPVDGVTGAANVQNVDAIFGKYIGKGDAVSETIADLMANGMANSQEEAQPLVMAAMNRAAARLAQRTADNFVGKLGNSVENIDQNIYNGWYSHDVQDALKKDAAQLGIQNNYFGNEQGGVEEVNSYDQFINSYVKPAMVESLVKKYGQNYRKQAEDIATRLYSHDDDVQDTLMGQDINTAIEGVISKYVSPSVVDEYNKAQEAGKEAFSKGMEGSQFIPANLRIGNAIASQYEANQTNNPQSVLNALNKKFNSLYKNGSFLTDIADATYKVMQKYGMQGMQTGNPEQFKPMVQGVIKNELDKLEIKGMMPKGSTEYIMKTGLGNTIVGKIARKAMQTDYQNQLEDIANQQYQPGFWENVASGALTFAGDAWSYWLPGAAGGKITKSMLAKAEGALATDLFAHGMGEKAAQRAAKLIIGKSKGMALKQGMAHGATTFGGQALVSTPVNEIYKEGQLDENGNVYEPSVDKVLFNTLGDVAKGAVLGTVMQGGTLANLVSKGKGLAVNILADVGGKAIDSGIMTGQSIIERMAADPTFKPTGKDAAESFLESMANLTAIGLPGILGKYARFKNAQEFNRKYDFTNEDMTDLNRLGYGNLYETFKEMGINGNRMLEGDGELMGQLSQKYMDFMANKSVPETLKAKVMAVVEGKRPESFSPVMDSQIIQPVDGKPIVETYNENGGVIERREYSSLDEAEKANKKLDYEKSLNLTAAYESAYHADALKDTLEQQYNQAVSKYNVGDKLTDEDKTAAYLYQNAPAIKDIINKRQQGMELTGKEQKLWNSYKRIYDGAFENSSIMKDYIRTFEDSMGVEHGTLRKALEGDGKSRTEEQQKLVEAYQKQLYGDIMLRRDSKVGDKINDPSRLIGENVGYTEPSPVNAIEASASQNAAERPEVHSVGSVPPTDGGVPPSTGGVPPVDTKTPPASSGNDAELSSEPADTSTTSSKASDAYVMGQNAYNNNDTDALKAINHNDDVSLARLNRAFKGSENMVSVVQKACTEGKDMELFIQQRANYLSPIQQDAIRKYVEAQDAKKGVYDALQHADDGYGDSLKEQLWPYATEDGNIVPATLTSGQQVFLKKSNEYGGGFVVVPDEQGAPTIKQVASSEVKEVGIPVPFDEYINQLVQTQQSNRAQSFFSQFDGSGLKPNETVEVAMEAGDDPVQMIFAGYSPDGKIVLSDGHDNISLSKDEFNVWKDNALQSSINAELDTEDIQRSNDEAMKAEAEKKQRYADNIVGYGEGQIDYSSKESNPKVVAEYLQEQYGEDHTKLINLINGSRHDVKEQLGNKKKAAAEYEQWLDTNADLDPDKAQKVNDELKLVNEQIADLEARYKNWNTIRNSVMTDDEARAMRDERKKVIEQNGIDESAIVPSEEREVPVLSDEELKKQYPTMDEASTYITSQRKQIYKIQSDEVQQELDGVNDLLEQYVNGEIDLEPEQLQELNTTKAQLEARHTNLNASAKDLKAQADNLTTLYHKENMAERKEKMANLSPAEQRAIQVENAIKDRNLSALNAIYEGTSVNFTDDTPNTIKEYVADSIGRHILNFEGKEKGGAFSNGVMQETGLGRKDFNQLQVLAREGEGMTVPEFVHKLYNGMPDHLRDQGFTDQDIRGALLDLLGSVGTYQELKNYTLREKVANAENEMRTQEAEEERMREEYEQETMVDGQVFSERLKNAISETETEPTDAQKKAGNYKKGHLSFGGYNFTVETPKGATRSGKDENGKPWSVTMHDTYGYILGKIGVDGDHIDMFINDSADLDNFNGDVVVIDQVNPETGEFDEHKVMYGYPDEAAATTAYLKNYSKDWKGLGKVTSVPKATFDKWLGSSDRKTKPFREYAMVQSKLAEKRLSYDVASHSWSGIPVGTVEISDKPNRNGDLESYIESNDRMLAIHNVHTGKSVIRVLTVDNQAETPDRINRELEKEGYTVSINGHDSGFVDFTNYNEAYDFAKHVDDIEEQIHSKAEPSDDNLPFDAPMNMDDLPFMRTVKPIMPKDMNEAQQVAFKAVQTMLKNAGIPVKVISNEDMDKVAAEYDEMVANLLLHDPNLRFNIKTPEEREAAERAYNWGKENRPDKWHQYVLVNMDRPNQMPEYYQKKSLADIQRRYYNKNVYDDWGELRGKPWGNYKLFDLNRPFEEQVKDVKGSVPTDYDPHRYDNKEYRKLKDQKKKLEAELDKLDVQRKDYMHSTMDKYVKELGLNSWDELPDDIWYKARREGFAIVDEKKKAIQAKIDEIEKKMDNLPLTSVAKQEQNTPSSVAVSQKEESSEDKYAKLFSLLDKKRNLETEYEEAAHNLENFTEEMLAGYRNRNNLAADAEVPGHVFRNAREAARAMYKKKMDACMAELNNLQKEIDALAPGGRVSFMRTYHGSGVDFSEFDFGHMGEGAGSQAFGWGGYVTSSKKIGKDYATMMDRDPSRHYILTQNSSARRFAKKYPTLESFLKGMDKIATNKHFTEQEKIDYYNERMKDAEPYHNMYEVDIPDDNGNNYLDWYKPLTDKQKDKIAKLLNRLKVDVADYERRGFSLDASFGDVYEYVGLVLSHNSKKYRDVFWKKAASKYFSSLGYTGIKYPAGTIMGGAEEGDTNYVIFKPEDMKITGHTKFAKGNSVVYGYTDGKQIVLNQDYLNPNTPLHEYQHIWRTAAKEQNPDLIKHGDDLIRKTSLYERVKSDPNYSHLSDEEICDEAFARLIGQDGEEILEDMANEAIKQDPFETAKELSVINRLKKWLKEFWYWTLNTFTKWKPEDIKKMTLQDIRNLVLRDLANGVNPRKAHEEYVKQKDAEYMEAVKNGDMEKAAEMVKEQANLMRAENPLPDQTMAYKTRNTAAPKKTIKVYKTFTLDKDGDPSALFVSGKDKLPVGVWLDGQDTYHFLADNGKYYVPSTKNPSTEGGKTGASIRIPNDEVRQQLIDQGYLPKGSKAKSITALAYRPGWHAGDLPFFPQGGKKVEGSAYGNVHRYNQVVFECEMDADKDYTPEAQAQDKARNADGSLNARNADLQYMPEGGYYSYTTNPMLQNTDKGHWFISGSLKINRALTQEECDRILAENGKVAQEWEQGILDLNALNYDPSKTDAVRKMLSPVTYDDNGNVIPLSQRFNPKNPNTRFMRSGNDDKTMFGMHNISIQKLRKAIKQGGFAAPSMGVVDSKNGVYTDYGEITLIPKAEKLDKRKGKNASTFTADAWTPTYPHVSLKASEEGEQKINRDTYENANMDADMGLDMRDKWTAYLSGGGKPILMAYQFLHETGKKPKLVKYPKEYSSAIIKVLNGIDWKDGKRRMHEEYTDEEIATIVKTYNKWLDDTGVGAPSEEDVKDKVALCDKKLASMKDSKWKDSYTEYRNDWTKFKGNKNEALDWMEKVMSSAKKQGQVDVSKTNDEAINRVESNPRLSADLNVWFDGKLSEYGVNEYLYNGKTPSGKSKYLPNTIDNAVKIMKKQGLAGGYNDFTVNVGSFIAKLAPTANTLSAMKKNRDKLIPYGDERHGEMRNQISSEFQDLGKDLKINKSDVWDDSGMYRMEELADVKPRDLKEYIKKNWKIDVSDDWVNRYNKLVDTIQNDYPVFYFETKFMRPYGLDEFEKAIVPKNTPQDVIDALKRAGIDVHTYNGKEDREQVTMDAINSSDVIKFSLPDSGTDIANGDNSSINNQNSNKDVITRRIGSRAQAQARVNGVMAETAATMGRGLGATDKEQSATWNRGRALRTLRARAKRLSAFLRGEELSEILGEYVGHGQENNVYKAKYDEHKVIKLNDFSLTDDKFRINEFIDRINAHNEFMPEDRYTPIGFADNKDGDFCIVMEQPYIKGVHPTRDEISQYLFDHGFELDLIPISKDETDIGWTNGKFDIWDAEPNNVIKDENGDLHFFDTMIQHTHIPNHKNPYRLSKPLIRTFESQQVKESEEKVKNVASLLGGAEVFIYTNSNEVPAKYRVAIEKGARGWYDPATHTVHIYLPNCVDAAEAQRTVFHEKIGHEGMEVLLGGENEVRKFADYVYKNAGKDIREKILSFANRYDPDWKDSDRMNVGTQEYIAHLAEEGPKTAADFSLWTKIKHYLIRLLKKMGIRVPGLLNDKDLRYYLMKAGKALHVWDNMPKEKQDAMMQQASTKDIKNSLGESDMKGKPRQKKGESAIQYMKRVMEWRKWKEAREDLDDPEPPQFYDLDKDAAGKKEWEKLNKEWRDRHGLKGNDMPSLPTRNEGESDESFLSRYKDYEKWQNAMKDNDDPAPDMFAWEKQKQVEASKKYEDWLARHELLEQQQADLDLYEGKIYPAETSPEAADMERKVMQDLAEVTSTDVSSEGAARTVKVSVIHRRKNMEEASADDAIYINDVKRSIEQMAESGAMDKLVSEFKGSKSKAESLAEAIPYIIEAPRRLRDLTHEMNASGVFDKNHLHIQPKDVEDIQAFVPELRRLASMTHVVVKGDKEVKVFDDMEGISKVASKMAKVINGNHQGEDYFVPIDGTDILDKQILPIMSQSIVPDGIDYHNLSEEMKSTLFSIRDWYNYTFDWLKDNHTLKEDVGYNADYVNHIWDKEKSDKKAYAMYVENRQRTKSPNEKKRTISTLMEGTGVGLVPKTTDITKMMAYYSRSNIEAWCNKTMLQELSGINVIERNEDGEIISSDPLISSTAPFNLEQYKYFEIPGVGPVWVYNVSPKQVGRFKNPITDKEHYLYKEASAGDRFGTVFDTYQSNNFWKFMDTAASSAKKLELGFSGFHAGALTEVYMVQNMIEFGPKKAFANFMKYIFVDTAKTHSLPCFANPEDFQEAATHLVKFGATNDYAAADVQNMFDDFRNAMEKIQKKLEEGNAISRAGATAALPLEVASQMLSLINKGMDVALWDFLHDGLKLATYRMRADATKARAAKQGWTQEQLSKQLDEDGQFVNDMFGGQHWDVLGASHTKLRYAGRILLSPDWNTSTTRHFLAVTGYGSVWNEATMDNFKQYYSHVKDAVKGKQEMTPEDWGRFSRSKSAMLCYGLGFMVFYEAIANGLNAAFRALDEERERKKAEELRKTNPDYRSPYELAYPEGMQWYDYLMRGNSLGQQSKVFLGRYEDGTEMYIRHGKQFREVPEYLFNHKGDLEFPGPMVQRMLGKANPMVRMTLDDINYLSDFQASHADQELQRKYGKTLGLLYKDALYWAPFLIPSQENKEFKAVDFFFPSSKGFSNWKAQDYFKTFILSGDGEGVWQTYASCQRNGLDAEKQLQAAIASIKALEIQEMQDGVTSLQIASERFDGAKSVKEKRKMREKMRKFLSQSEYQAFTWQNAQDMVDAFQNGEDVKELTKADDKYLNVATSEDVTEDWRIQSIRSNSKGYADKLAELQETDKAKAASFKNAHANIFKARKTISKANSKMNKLKKKLGEGNDKQVLQQIRNVRQELLKDLKNMEHLKKYED